MQAPSAARLRPQSELLEVDYKLDPESVNYDPSVPEDKRIETIRYTSSVGASKNQYAVLVVRDGAFLRSSALLLHRTCPRCRV